MQLDIDKEVALLQRMTVGQLRERFEETWGEPLNTAISNGYSSASPGRCKPISRVTFPRELDVGRPN